MKKIITISILSLIIFACSHKTTSSVTTTAGREKTESATVSHDQYLEGKAVYEVKCSTCHKLKNPARGTMEKWYGWIERMAPKAKLTDVEKTQVTNYISVNALPN